jgi:hypothetical protein
MEKETEDKAEEGEGGKEDGGGMKRETGDKAKEEEGGREKGGREMEVFLDNS